MPIIKSAKKRVRVTKKATIRNVKTKRTLKDAVKAFHAAVSGKKNVSTAHQKAQSTIDQAAKKGVMHKNKAARKKSQLARAAKSAGVKPTKATVKKTATKPVAKKSAAKKSPAKKTTAKKSK